MTSPMSSPSNVVPESGLEAQAAAVAIPVGRQLDWSVRRELWENRSIYLAPAAVAAFTLLGFLISVRHLPSRMREAIALDPMQQREIIERPLDFAALLIMGVALLVAIFYCLDALYGERRDRSILFWKSLPVSDLTTVLAKASIPILVLPLVAFGVTMIAQGIMLLVSRAVLAGSGVNTEAIWNHISFSHISMMLLYHLVAIHGFLYAPFYGWLLLVSAWARRLPILWAALPPVALGVFEKIAFNTSYFAGWLMGRLGGGSDGAAPAPGSMSMDALTRPLPGQFLANPDLWVGLALTAGFLAIAVRLRRDRGPI
jgi:ABC-2 type transport system permease protein